MIILRAFISARKQAEAELKTLDKALSLWVEQRMKEQKQHTHTREADEREELNE